MSIEWSIIIAHHKNNASQRPNISSGVVFFSLQDFRSLVEQSAYIFDQVDPLLHLRRNPKITKLYSVLFAFQKYITRLDISMQNISSVQVLKCQEQLTAELFDSIERQLVTFHVVEVYLQITLVAVIKKNAKNIFILKIALECTNI